RVAGDPRAGDPQRERVAVEGDRAAAAAARGAGPGRVGAGADRLVCGERAVGDVPGPPDAGQCAAVGADAAGERAADDPYRLAVVPAVRAAPHTPPHSR